MQVRVTPWTIAIMSVLLLTRMALATEIENYYPLTLGFAGSGAGSVNGGLSCSTGESCAAAEFPENSVVTLMATPDMNSLFDGWSGECTMVGDDCRVTMNGARTVTANFSAAPPVRIAGGASYSLLAEAYAQSHQGAVIQARAVSLSGDLVFGRPIRVSLKGGYDASFLNSPGQTTVQGRLLVRNGTLRVSGLAVAASAPDAPAPSTDPTAATVTITDGATGAPVAGATVRIGDRAAVTGADGSCVITGLSTVESSLSVTRPGYHPSGGSVAAGTPISLTLSPLATPASYDLVVVGAGTGGVAAAIQAARQGLRVALLEESDWIGGQMTSAAVTSLDEGNFLKAGNRSGIYREFVDQVKQHYAALGKSTGTAYYYPGSIAFEPSVGQRILYRMLPAGAAPSGPTLDLYLRTRVTGTLASGNAVTGVVLADGSSIASKVTVDATEYGDLLPLTGARYRAGNSTSDSLNVSANINPTTWTAVLKKYPSGMDRELLLPSAPSGYQETLDQLRAWLTLDGGQGDLWFQQGKLDTTKPLSFAFHSAWRGMPDSGNPENYEASAEQYLKITKTGLNGSHNDYPVTVRYLEDPAYRKQENCAAKLRTLQTIFYMQSELGQSDWSVAVDEGYDTPYSREENPCPALPPEYAAVERHLPVHPYVRESRRAIGMMTLTEQLSKRDGVAALRNFPSSLAVADYPYDIHGAVSSEELDMGDSAEDLFKPWTKRGGSFQVPFETFIPETVDGLLMAEKNLSASRLVSSALRLQPITLMTGQAAGALAAVAVQQGVQPREVRPIEVQAELLEQGAMLALYNPRDVPVSHPYWKHIQLAILYDLFDFWGGSFNPNGAMKRSELAYLLLNTFGSNQQVGDPELPATRADFAQLFASAMELDLAGAPTVPAYDDVPASHPAFAPVQLLHDLGVFGPLSSPGSFLPESALTRGEVAYFTVNAALLSGRSKLNKLALQGDQPSGITGSVTVNGGAEATGGAAVTVALAAHSIGNTITSMQFKVDDGSWDYWEPFAGAKTFTIPGGNGTHIVQARFRDSIGNVSQPFSDSITLDTTLPTGSLVINDGARSTVSTSVALKLSASGGGAPVTNMQFSKDGTTWYAWEPFSTTRSLRLSGAAGMNTVYVRFRDGSGRVSAPYSDSIVLAP